MGSEIVSLVVALVLFALAFVREKKQRRGKDQAQRTEEMPPGPAPFPVLGNILQLSFAPHRSFARLAQKHGPVMTLRLGAMTTVVVSSSAAARETLKLHDAALAGRVVYEAMRLGSGSEGSMITAQPGPSWRMLRRLCNNGFFTAARLDAMQGVRSRCVDALVRRVGSEGMRGARPVDIGRLLFLMAFDHIGRLVLSRELLDSESTLGGEFFHHSGRIMELAGKPNVADLVPALRGLDPQGIRRKMSFHVGRALEIVVGFVEERMGRQCDEDGGGDDDSRKDFLDLLLEFEGDGMDEPAKLSRNTINNFIFEMFVAGTETSASTMEWVMAELLRHPAAMSKVQAELRQATSKGQDLEEKDMVNLPYLNAVIKETMRLHPPLPLLIPHKAVKPCTILGYHIPQGTQILVNVWGLGRDHESWDNPAAFRPERFTAAASPPDYTGQNYEFLPFGSGRRMCPAVRLMSRMLPLVIGTLLRSFDWALPGGLHPNAVDMREQMGITLRKAVPLRVMATPYEREDRKTV